MFKWLLVLALACMTAADDTISNDKLKVLAVATYESESLERYIRTGKVNNLNVKILGLGQPWTGGDMSQPGGAVKIRLLREELQTGDYKDDDVILFTDSYDVMLIAPAEEILTQFQLSGAKILFSAEPFCWPDESLAEQYPVVQRGKRFLNSGGFIGYKKDVLNLIKDIKFQDNDDDQLIYTKLYLDEDVRAANGIKLDSRVTIFHNLNGATSEVELVLNEKGNELKNTVHGTKVLVVHANGPSGVKSFLSSLGNYLTDWSPETGCGSCWDNMLSLQSVSDDKLPVVTIGVFIDKPTPFMEEFWLKIRHLDYPTNKIHLFIHNNAKYHQAEVEEYVANYTKEYASIKTISPDDNVKEWHGRNLAIDYTLAKNSDYYFSIDSVAHMDNPFALKLLIEQNRKIVAPLLVRPYKAWSNFWGALSSEGFYARSNDYMEIVKGERRGLWNVPFISGAYLVNATLLKDEKTRPNYINNLLDADMAFCTNNRERGIFMYVTNRVDWGHLVNADNFETSHKNNEMYQLFDNRWDWELRYLHPNWSQSLEPNATLMEPCPDVYWFPIVTPRYCKEFIEMMEHNGKWSDGSNYDPRLDGGYENVPTVDIHMNQVGFEPHWLEILRLYVEPLQSKVYVGYHHYPPHATMNFVVRYKPDEQRELKPHHDTSTYTINIALNRPGIDYEGGGCRFTRYNCSVVDSKLGWLIMHPGKLTHQHEGLRVTKGTRYIMVSFVDP